MLTSIDSSLKFGLALPRGRKQASTHLWFTRSQLLCFLGNRTILHAVWSAIVLILSSVRLSVCLSVSLCTVTLRVSFQIVLFYVILSLPYINIHSIGLQLLLFTCMCWQREEAELQRLEEEKAAEENDVSGRRRKTDWMSRSGRNELPRWNRNKKSWRLTARFLNNFSVSLRLNSCNRPRERYIASENYLMPVTVSGTRRLNEVLR